jgi:tetratricopeptide (TPR) repeat protein
LAIFRELGDLQPQAQILNNMGTFAYFSGRWDEAVDRWERGRELRVRTGDAVEAANGTNNVAEVLSDQGHLEAAESRFREALRVWKAAGFDTGVAFVEANLGRVAYRAGRPDEGAPLLSRARATFADAGYIAQVLETDTRIAECHLVARRPEDALAVAEGALAVEASREGLGYQRAALLRARGCALAQLGELGKARESLQESLQAAGERAADHEIAFTLCAIVELDALEGVETDEALEEERGFLFERLGIVRAPSFALAN